VDTKENGKPVLLLMAEDDPEDQMLVRDAFQEAQLAYRLMTVNNGEELLDYLLCRDGYDRAERPDLILLDLNMPRKDGREAIADIKSDPSLRSIPIIVLTTSASEEDIARSYELGVSSYICKPVTFERLVKIVRLLGQYWFETAELPPSS